MRFYRPRRFLATAAACLCVAALSGCASDQIEYEGRVFDWIGMSDNAKRASDVRVVERAPLVVPPNTASLPAPGSGSAVAQRQDWPTSPEHVRNQMAEERRAKEIETAQEADPLNPYAGKPTLLDNLFGRNRQVNEVEVADVPEPDPADVSPEERRRALGVEPARPTSGTLADAAPPPSDPFRNAGPVGEDTYSRVSNPHGQNRQDPASPF
jgi:hypothetical protein